MRALPLDVCRQAIEYMAAYEAGQFVEVSRRDAWLIHGLEDLNAGSLVYEGAYTEFGCIYFVGNDGFAYKIHIEKKELSSA